MALLWAFTVSGFHFDTDPDAAFHFDVDLNSVSYPAFLFDTDPAFQNNCGSIRTGIHNRKKMKELFFFKYNKKFFLESGYQRS